MSEQMSSILCPECSARFRVEPSRIARTGSTTRCLRCHARFRVLLVDGIVIARAILALPLSTQGARFVKAEESTPVNKPDGPRWQMLDSAVYHGTLFTLQEIRTHIRTGSLCRNDRVRREGQKTWEWAGGVPEFSHFFEFKAMVEQRLSEAAPRTTD